MSGSSVTPCAQTLAAQTRKGQEVAPSGIRDGDGPEPPSFPQDRAWHCARMDRAFSAGPADPDIQTHRTVNAPDKVRRTSPWPPACPRRDAWVRF